MEQQDVGHEGVITGCDNAFVLLLLIPEESLSLHSNQPLHIGVSSGVLLKYYKYFNFIEHNSFSTT
ncbi:hypothetical protein [Lysinibacillus xylanilyticus]|uniref:hypothetical protein n=1 Tax=Lysinibacillus xylanilyticus TaxID=582475 RepID=UPI003816FD82